VLQPLSKYTTKRLGGHGNVAALKWVQTFVLVLNLKTAVSIAFCSPTIFEEMEGGTSGISPSSPKANFYHGIGATFCARFALISAVNFRFCAPYTMTEIDGIFQYKLSTKLGAYFLIKNRIDIGF